MNKKQFAFAVIVLSLSFTIASYGLAFANETSLSQAVFELTVELCAVGVLAGTIWSVLIGYEKLR